MSKYSDFKSYIQDKQAELLLKEVSEYVNESQDNLGDRSINELLICNQHVENIEVKSLNCRGTGISIVDIDVNVTADIVTDNRGSLNLDTERKTKWFTVHEKTRITDKLDVLEVRTEEYDSAKFDKLSVLDEFLIPYVYSADLEDIADDFYEFYCKNADYVDGYAFPFLDVLKELGIDAYEADLPEKNMGRMYFREDKASLYKWVPQVGDRKFEHETVKPGTMLISRGNYFLGNAGSYILTIAHEVIHWYYHQAFFKIIALLDDEKTMMPCDVEPQRYNENMSSLQKALWFVEWQANSIGMRIAMPQTLFVKAMYEAKAEAERIPRMGSYNGELMEDIIERVAKLFRVSRFAAKQRAIQLGADAAAGTCIYIDGHYHAPFAFTEGTLDSKQTFTIDLEAFENLKKVDYNFCKLIDSGQFIYLGYVVCINDPRYIEELSEENAKWLGSKYDLTPYGRDHVDECCLIFDWESISGVSDDGGFYGQCYLSRDVSADSRVEYYYNKDFETNQDTEALAAEIQRYKEAFEAENKVLGELAAFDNFPDMLTYHMDRKHITVESLALQSGLSNTTIKKYRAGTSKPDLDNMMAIFIGLNLPEKYCDKMLDVADMSLSESNTKQKVYRVLIREHSDGTLDQWNKILDGFNLARIPNNRNQKNL